MRSPIAVEEPTARHTQAVLQDTLAGALSTEMLAERIAMHIESLVPRGRARCLDIGGGATPGGAALGLAVQDRLARVDWQRIDVQGLAAAARNNDDRVVFEEREFDVALICDVLHRTDLAAQVLAAANRSARRVLVKDRFEHGSCSLTASRLVGTRHNGVAQRYFTRESLTRLAGEQQFVITALDCGPSLYGDLPVARTPVPRTCDFIAVLRRRAT